MHRAGSAAATLVCSAIASAIVAPGGLILETVVDVKLLLTRGEDELLATVSTDQSLVLVCQPDRAPLLRC